MRDGESSGTQFDEQDAGTYQAVALRYRRPGPSKAAGAMPLVLRARQGEKRNQPGLLIGQSLPLSSRRAKLINRTGTLPIHPMQRNHTPLELLLSD